MLIPLFLIAALLNTLFKRLPKLALLLLSLLLIEPSIAQEDNQNSITDIANEKTG